MNEQVAVQALVVPKRIPLRVIGLVVGLIVALVASIVIIVRRAPPPAYARSIGARLELAAGDVLVHEQGFETKALSGTPLGTGATITTGKGARALVRAGDGTAVFLRGETAVVLEPRGLAIEKGEAWLDAPRGDGQAIECRLGKHVVSASDAGLSITRSGDSVSVYVARGLAILTSPGGRVEIRAGTQGTAHANESPKLAAVAFWQDWTGGMGDARPAHGAAGSGSGRIYGIDTNALPGSPAKKLGIAKQVVHAVVRDGIAETEVDQTFSNPGGQAIEGWYWFTIPVSSTVTSFALETNGQLVEGEVIEKHEAAARYQAAVQRANDPALLEWVDGHSYRARIFPIPASGTRRVVLRYIELLPSVEGKTHYVYPLRSEDPVRFDEFALSVDLGDMGHAVEVSTSLDATLENGGRFVTMRRSGYAPQADFQLEMIPKVANPPVRAWRFGAGTDQADYVMLRYVPDRDASFAKLPPVKGELVVVVDTSAGGDETARAERAAAAEAILRALSDEDRFALVALDVAPEVVYPKEGLAQATDAEVAKALEKLSDHGTGGATDLGAMFEPALERLHGTEQPAIVYVGDGNATSGETTADTLMGRMRRSLSGSRARLFAVGVGADADHALLEQLTRAGSGQYLRINEADETTGQALRLTSAIKTPTITDLDVDLGAGLDQPFYSAAGKLARGEELVLFARTHHQLPKKVTVKGRVGGKDFATEYPLPLESNETTALVPRLWAAEYVRRLLGSGGGADDNKSKVLDLGLEYGLMTPYTSILALDSEEAYARQGVGRRSSRLRGVRLTSIAGESGESGESELPSPFALAAGCEARSKDSPSAPTSAVGEMRQAATEPTAAVTAPPEATPTATITPTLSLQASAEGDPRGDDGTASAIGLGGGGALAKGFPGQRAIAPTNAMQPLPGSPPPPAAPSRGATARPLHAAKTIDDARSRNTDGHRDAKDESSGKEASRISSIPRRALATCSDASSRPLAERIVLWQKRLRRASQSREIVDQYEAARAGCELPDWRDQASLLDLVQARTQNEEAVNLILAHFAGEPEAQRFVARALLRRTVDVRMAAAVSRALFGDKVDWAKVDRELLDVKKPEDRLLHLKAAMLVSPGDPAGDARLVRLLGELGRADEAVAYGRRLRDRGLLTPTLAQSLGDALSVAGLRDEAMRTYSEIVEFNGNDPASRRLLGDIYLRNGWYDAAYRQYTTLTDLDPKSPSSWLRLAAAAAGAGRIDEALRVEREVQSGEGTPGPDDPRYWARLWSAARLGTLLSDPATAGGGGADTKEAILRKLKELGLFSGPGTLALLTWEDHDARLALGAADVKKDTLAGDPTDAGPTGLYGVVLSQNTWDRQAWAVRWAGDAPARPVKFSLVRLSWDGKTFGVAVENAAIKPDDKQKGV